jgi:hypothetical protein
MLKKYGQTVIAILSAAIITSAVGTAHIKAGALTLDQLYVETYNQTVNARNVRTQMAINQARIAIESLRGTGAEWAIGEFSKQVDQVQHPFLVTIVDAITKAQKSIRQADINAARAAIDPDLPQIWKNSYSSALDQAQETLMKQLITACSLAVQDNTAGNKEKVMLLIDELKTALNPDIGAWAEEIAKPVLTDLSDSDIANLYEGIVQRDMLASNNIQNFGFVATDGIWEYRNKLEGGQYKLYKIKLDGSQSVKLSDDSAVYINVSGDWVYYSSASDSGKIYKVKTDGTNRIKALDASGWPVRSVRVVGDWIYYVTSESGGAMYICRVKTDGTGYTKFTLNNNSIFLTSDYINVIGDWIYTVCAEPVPNTDYYASHLYKIKVDGSQVVKINEDYSYRLNVLGEWIYYQNPNDNYNIYKIKIYGTEKTKLTNYTLNDGNVYNFIATYQGIFYSVHDSNFTGSDAVGLYKIMSDGSNVKRLTDSYVRFINSINNWIYFEGENNRYRMMTDGTNLQELN